MANCLIARSLRSLRIKRGSGIEPDQCAECLHYAVEIGGIKIAARLGSLEIMRSLSLWVLINRIVFDFRQRNAFPGRECRTMSAAFHSPALKEHSDG